MPEVFDAYALYYDLLYSDKDYAAEVAFVKTLLHEQGITSGHVLELGSGTGTHAQIFAESGFKVTGVDMSSTMTAKAQQKLRQLPRPIQENISFETGDIRSWQSQEKFDIVISLFHVFSYQTSNHDFFAALKTAESHLKPGGILVFDFWYGPGVLSDKPSDRVKHMENEMIQVKRNAKPIMHPNDNIVDVHYAVNIKSKTTNEQLTVEEKHEMRYFFGPELEAALNLNHLKMIKLVDWMTNRAPGFESWCAAVVATKDY